MPAWTTSSPSARCALEARGDVPHMSLNRQKMNPAVKQLWLEAPRSGNYKQGLQSFTGQNFLLSGRSLRPWRAARHHTSPHVDPYLDDTYRYAGVTGGLPDEVKQWAGIETSAGYFLGDNRFTSLATVNDRGSQLPTNCHHYRGALLNAKDESTYQSQMGFRPAEW